MAITSYDQLGKARKIAIMISLVSTQLVQMMPLGGGLATSLYIGEQIGATGRTATWIVAAYSMTQGAFVLAGGRVGDVFGHKNVLLGGAGWWVIWSLASGFAHTIAVLALFRGLSGIGAALIVPNAVALLGHTFPPGLGRNIAMGVFGAMAPIGAAGGSVISALLVQLTAWRWLFFFFAILGTFTFSVVIVLVPQSHPSDKGGKIDWMGAYLGVGGLILFNFVWNQAPIVGWQNPYEYTLLLVSILHLSAFIFWEAKVAQLPILPFDIWTAPSMPALMLVVLLSLMSFGIFSWYIFVWNLTVRAESLLTAAVQIQPLTVGAVLAAATAAFLVPRLAAQHLLAIGAGAMMAASILLATMPAQQNYWATEFVALALAAFCPDLVFTAAQIIASNSVQRHEQGIAGSLVGTLFTYGISTGLGLGGTVDVRMNRGGEDPVRGYRSALYLGIGFAAASLVLSLLFVRIKKDEREGWDEKDGRASSTPTDRDSNPSGVFTTQETVTDKAES